MADRKPRKNVSEADAQGGQADNERTPQTVEIAKAGIRTGQDFANLMAALMSDVLEGRVSPVVANAACNAGGKLLKVVEMQYRYGKAPPIEAQTPYLELASPRP